MAGSFVAAADGHGGTPVTEAQPGPQPLLTHPRGLTHRRAYDRVCFLFLEIV
jgi:hypothetical protein